MKVKNQDVFDAIKEVMQGRRWITQDELKTKIHLKGITSKQLNNTLNFYVKNNVLIIDEEKGIISIS